VKIVCSESEGRGVIFEGSEWEKLEGTGEMTGRFQSSNIYSVVKDSRKIYRDLGSKSISFLFFLIMDWVAIFFFFIW